MNEKFQRIKGSKQFDLTIENFAEKIDNGGIVAYIGEVANRQWGLLLFKQVYENGDDDELFYTIETAPLNYKTLSYTHWLCFVNQDETRHLPLLRSAETSENHIGKYRMELDRLLGEGRGFLHDGSLKIRIEIRIDWFISIHFRIDTRMFNIYDPFENCVMFKGASFPETFYARKEIIMHHCLSFRPGILAGDTVIWLPQGFDSYTVGEFLQELHGVPCYLNAWSFESRDQIYFLSIYCGALNRQQFAAIFAGRQTHFPLEYGTLSCQVLKQVLKTVKNLEDLRENVRVWDVSSKLRLEMLKAITQKFFSFEIDEKR